MILIDRQGFLLALYWPLQRTKGTGSWSLGLFVCRLIGGWHVECCGIVTQWYRQQSQPLPAVETKAMTP